MARLASTYADLERWNDALALDEHVLEVRRRILGVENQDTLEAMLSLSITFENLGRMEEAEEPHQEMLDITK
jgi:hypothetical protein